MIGNFIADHIRGNKFQHLPSFVQKGIQLHRAIDTFTDSNAIVRISKRRLHERYGHYDGVIIDIFYDHFLAKDWAEYSEIPLDIYTKGVYDLLHKNQHILPQKTLDLLPYITKYDWLYNYQFIDGIQEVLIGMNRRTKGKSKMDLAKEDLLLHYEAFQNDFNTFMPQLKHFTQTETSKLCI